MMAEEEPCSSRSIRRVEVHVQPTDSPKDPESMNILRLSDEVLLMIIVYVPSKDLVHLSRVCRRFENLCSELKLWERIICPSEDYRTLRQIFRERLGQGQTTHLMLAGANDNGLNPGFRSSISLSMIDMLKNPLPLHLRQNPNLPTKNLTHLYLIRQRLDGRYFKLTQLPESLRVLHLTGTHMTHVDEEFGYFKRIDQTLPELEELDLCRCLWVTSHALLALSKLPKLTKLVLSGNRNVGGCIAYASLASRFGFKTLKVLDLTNTNSTDSDFMTFCTIPNLEELYCGQYDKYQDIWAVTDQLFNSIFAEAPGVNFKLKVIDVSGSEVTDEVLSALARLHIEKFYCYFTGVTARGAEEHMNHFMQCKIYRDETIFLE